MLGVLGTGITLSRRDTTRGAVHDQCPSDETIIQQSLVTYRRCRLELQTKHLHLVDPFIIVCQSVLMEKGRESKHSPEALNLVKKASTAASSSSMSV